MFDNDLRNFSTLSILELRVALEIFQSLWLTTSIERYSSLIGSDRDVQFGIGYQHKKGMRLGVNYNRNYNNAFGFSLSPGNLEVILGMVIDEQSVDEAHNKKVFF